MFEVVWGTLAAFFVLFVPGLTLTLVLYPKPGKVDVWERAALSLGFSVLVLIYTGVIFAMPQIKMLSLVPITGTLVVFSVVCVLIGYMRGAMALFKKPSAATHAG
jgi:uncharacterized membrane protein